MNVVAKGRRGKEGGKKDEIKVEGCRERKRGEEGGEGGEGKQVLSSVTPHR